MPDTPEHQPVENKPQRTARERPPLIEQIQIFRRRLEAKDFVVTPEQKEFVISRLGEKGFDMITGPNWSGTPRELQELLEQRPPQRRSSTAANGVEYTTVDYSDVYELLEEAEALKPDDTSVNLTGGSRSN